MNVIDSIVRNAVLTFDGVTIIKENIFSAYGQNDPFLWLKNMSFLVIRYLY